jgi:hypothetical protein
LVAAVCDGHGGPRYVRSDIGSRLGVEVACDVGRRVLQELGSSPTASAVESALSGPTATAIVDRWRQRVTDDVQQRAFTEDERARAGAPLEHDPHISYGATLLLAILGPSWIGLLQIGDGDVTVVSEGFAAAPVPDDDRLVGGETTSLCLPGAVTDARVRALVEPLPELVVLTTDGYANSFASPTWRTEVGLDLRDHVRRLGLGDVETRLPAWLADSAAAGGDDVSMALIQLVDQGSTAPIAVGAPVASTRGESPADAPVAARRHPGGLLAVGIVAALIGVGAGWFVGRGTDAATSTTTSAGSTTSVGSTSTTTIPASVVPSSTAAPTTVTPVVLGPGDEPVLLIGEGNDALLLAIAVTTPLAPRAQSLGWVCVENRVALLPEPWRFENGTLTRRTQSHQAIAVAVVGDQIWTVEPDRTTLASFDVRTGDPTGRTPIAGAVDRATAAPSTSACATPTQTGAPTSSIGFPATTALANPTTTDNHNTTTTRPTPTQSSVGGGNG